MSRTKPWSPAWVQLGSCQFDTWHRGQQVHRHCTRRWLSTMPPGMACSHPPSQGSKRCRWQVLSSENTIMGIEMVLIWNNEFLVTKFQNHVWDLLDPGNFRPHLPLDVCCPSMEQHAQLKNWFLLPLSLILRHLNPAPHVVGIALLRDERAVDNPWFGYPP